MPKARKRKKLKRVGYAAVINMQKMLEAHRAGKLSRQVTVEKLIELGIAPGDAARVKNALIDLTFVDKDGYQTPLFASLVTASEEEYREILANVLRHVYAEVFDQINPATATQEQLKKAFSVYAFPKLHRKMVALFKELAQQAGLLTKDTEVSEMPDTSQEPMHLAFQEPPVIDSSHTVEGVTHMTEHPSMPQTNDTILTPNFAKVDEVGELLTSLFQLPKSPGWTEGDRLWWQQAVFSAVSRLSQELTSQEGTKR
jgi:hypothetical protein